jgi:hypothetical protein
VSLPTHKPLKNIRPVKIGGPPISESILKTVDELIPFAAADQRLIQAAQAENFRIVELK